MIVLPYMFVCFLGALSMSAAGENFLILLLTNL